MKAGGTHCIADLFGCKAAMLDDSALVLRALFAGVAASGLTIVQHLVYRFAPIGVTAIAVLAESHLSIHTWPEMEYVAVDLFTCGTTASPELACRELARQFGAAEISCRTLRRGDLPREPVSASHNCVDLSS